ncbi:hypothetical protein N7474_005072 [Penicillium riverlandense]|uniref:uncharacterized protein n=1 Tax=Penicillium riverlandense TaxID=1903569 RepID=UPI00254878B1|nr:uncharacterized protein N7474_005072 [Penicillium riverlandense]KAJ5819481.1 hypothetical protein N7474_005072 [Penicillium riverlandense]
MLFNFLLPRARLTPSHAKYCLRARMMRWRNYDRTDSDPATRPKADGARHSAFDAWRDNRLFVREDLCAEALSATLDSAALGPARSRSVLHDLVVPASEVA